jgi:hypothetical protein
MMMMIKARRRPTGGGRHSVAWNSNGGEHLPCMLPSVGESY